MENATKNINTKQRQFEIMLNFMTDHSQLAKGYIKAPDAKQATNNLWTRLAEDLNAAGPPMREVVGWKKVWPDHKTSVNCIISTPSLRILRSNRSSSFSTQMATASIFITHK